MQGPAWSHALTHALVGRGEDAFAARAHVEVAPALIRAAFQRWSHEDGSPGLDQLIGGA
ncbi:hypothetical protein ABT288_37205 [Streptomyces sp. NPDC001093]|uniref:hypothetical protein n=1 Tax=Streptomyces sp. NPDC001093 TaxID=3154376 RepID=UPI003331764E